MCFVAGHFDKERLAEDPEGCNVPVKIVSPRLIATVVLWIAGYGCNSTVTQWATSAVAAAGTASGQRAFISNWQASFENFLIEHWQQFCLMVRSGSMAHYATLHDVHEEEESGVGGSAAHTAGSSLSKVRTRSRGYVTTLVSGHSDNLADMLPCTSAADCEMFPACDNVIRGDLVQVKICRHLEADPAQGQVDYAAQVQRGLYCKEDTTIPAGTWVASFGPVVADNAVMREKLGYAVQVSRGSAAQEGNWSRKVEMVTPVPGWKGTYHGPYVNHTCCLTHVNAEYVSTEDYGNHKGARISTVYVRTTKDVVCSRSVLCAHPAPEITVHYGPDVRRIVGACRCCACEHGTPECRKSWADGGSSR